jgi:hypothetical protein
MRGPTEVRTAWVETRTLIPGTPTPETKGHQENSCLLGRTDGT